MRRDVGMWPMGAILLFLALVTIAIVAYSLWSAAADNGHAPEPPLAPTRIAMTVLPTSTLVPAPTMALLLPVTPDQLPVATVVVTRTPTPAPTETPVPQTPARPAVQRG